MSIARPVLLLLSLASFAQAQDTVQISIGVRETGFAGGSWLGLGANGGAGGGIEWINQDAQTLTLDGTWQQFTFNLTSDPIAGFAGASANGILEGDHGTLEHIRILNSGGRTDPITLWIDQCEQTTTPSGGSPTTSTLESFDAFAPGQYVMFQHPGFSGSTSGNVAAGSSGGVDDTIGATYVPGVAPSPAMRFDFQFVDNTPTRWVRLTTFNATNVPNPQIRFDDSCVISFWMRGGVDQEDLGAQGPGGAVAEIVGTGLAAGQSSTYWVGNVPPGAPGLLFVSFDGFTDIPIAGGTLVSATGVLAFFDVSADPFGLLSLPVPGAPFGVDLVVQSLFVDGTLPQALTISNAVLASFG